MKRSISGRVKLNELALEWPMTPAASPDRLVTMVDLSYALCWPGLWDPNDPPAWTVPITALPPELLAKCLDVRSDALVARLLDELPDNVEPVRSARRLRSG